ncbi:MULTISPECIES: YmfL family putative regulatory protein [unclassified Burkholderia]|uniref:YmfL family putative regulatory protein n=1 Tax=unclassified Burkholderia TaxID=2613784 RepID=UPI000F575AB0|nr:MULTISPECIES: YmfL family putative regulatory protein [unclassified Burkholderia]
MGLRKAYQAMCRALPGGAEAMAAALGMSAASLQNRIYEVKGQVLHTEHALAMQTLSGRTDFAEAIARMTGGMFVQLPSLEDECDNQELLTKFTLILDQLGVLARTHAKAIEDGVVDDQEKAELERIAHDAHRHIQELLQLTFRIYRESESAGDAPAARALRTA